MVKKVIINKIKIALENEYKDIVLKLKQGASIDIDLSGDETDLIQAKTLGFTLSQLVARNKEKLVKIELALKKIADGSFGVCDDCGEEINSKRIQFMPYISICVGCAENQEKNAKMLFKK
jgi:DnaK suppressor protein